MALPSNEIQYLMKAAAYHAEVSGEGEASMRDFLEQNYRDQSTPYQRRRALELATQAIGVGLRLRELNPQDELRAGLHFARPPAPTVGVRVRLNYSDARMQPGDDRRPADWVTKYVPMSWTQTVAEVGAAIREMLEIAGYTEEQIKAIMEAGARTAADAAEREGRQYAGAWWEFVGPTLFPIS